MYYRLVHRRAPTFTHRAKVRFLPGPGRQKGTEEGKCLAGGEACQDHGQLKNAKL